VNVLVNVNAPEINDQRFRARARLRARARSRVRIHNQTISELGLASLDTEPLEDIVGSALIDIRIVRGFLGSRLERRR